MIRELGNSAAAELVKLRGLPAAVATVFGTAAAGIALASAIAASAPRSIDVTPIMTQTVVFLQVGPILLGVLSAASEYTGRQIVTTLTATPDRPLLLSAKGIAFLAAVSVTSLAAVGAGAATARIVLGARSIRRAHDTDPWPLAGAALYLVLIGLLAFAVALLLRSLIPPLAALLALVLVVSPLLAGYTEHARWLPDRAGRLLYLPGADPVLTAGTGALVLLAWIVVAGAAASVTFLRRDA